MDSPRLVGSGLGRQRAQHCLLFGLGISGRPGQRLGLPDWGLTVSAPQFLSPWDGISSSQHPAATGGLVRGQGGRGLRPKRPPEPWPGVSGRQCELPCPVPKPET